ncbi:hypothetical protein C6T56_22720 [Burkholderia multivorans]|nr:hypothetical protein C6T56_22720 [Burkholderia multivorans]
MALRLDRRVRPRRRASPISFDRRTPPRAGSAAAAAAPCARMARRHPGDVRSCCDAATQIVRNSHITKSHFTKR